MNLFSGAVVEIQRVNIQEKVLRVWVWIKAGELLRHDVQTLRHRIVRSVKKLINDQKNCWHQILDEQETNDITNILYLYIFTVLSKQLVFFILLKLFS